MLTLATIGYERTTPASLITTLHETGVELLVDVRAVASSRRPGFAKTALTANLRSGGIDYLHLRGLGTPADGRAAARAGRHEDLRRSYIAHLRTSLPATISKSSSTWSRPVGPPACSASRPGPNTVIAGW
ncbi:MAG: DUF488 domain-containing protein [Gemmatimonadota bacterium]